MPPALRLRAGVSPGETEDLQRLEGPGSQTWPPYLHVVIWGCSTTWLLLHLVTRQKIKKTHNFQRNKMDSPEGGEYFTIYVLFCFEVLLPHLL